MTNVSDTGKRLGASIATLRRWVSGKSIAENTVGGRRCYDLTKLRPELFKQEDRGNLRTVIYVHVSSHDQKNDLEQQK